MKQKSLIVFALYIVAALSMPQHISAQVGNVFRQEGLASWYGQEFDGRPTASGEIFNSTQFTAAHPSLPFGTFLLVTNKQNNRQITVKVNDRGPFVASRIIDLSKAAAEHLDMIASGTAHVIIETMPTAYSQPVEPPPPPAPITVTSAMPPIPGPGYGPEPSVPTPAAPAVSVVPGDQSSFPFPPVTVNIYSTPQPQAEYETVPIQPIQPLFDPYAQPWLQSMQQPYTPSPFDYKPEPAAPPAYAPPPPPPAYTPPPPVYAPPLSSGLKLLPAINPQPGRFYRLQVGSYKIPRHAVDAFDKLKAAGLNPSYEPNGEFYRVVLTRVPGTEVPSVVAKLEYAGFREALIREDR